MSTMTENYGTFENSLGQTVEIYREGDKLEVFTAIDGKTASHTTLDTIVAPVGTRPFADIFAMYAGESTNRMDTAQSKMIDALEGVAA